MTDYSGLLSKLQRKQENWYLLNAIENNVYFLFSLVDFAHKIIKK
jgi:hypothetical protein